MKQVDLKIEFSAYYNKKRETFDGGLYPILEYIKENPKSFKGFGEQPFLFMENKKLIEYYDILLSEQYPL